MYIYVYIYIYIYIYIYFIKINKNTKDFLNNIISTFRGSAPSSEPRKYARSCLFYTQALHKLF